MKRPIGIFLVVSLIITTLSGCTFWMDGEYLSVVPHVEEGNQSAYEVIQVDRYDQLQLELERLVESGADGGMFSLSPFDSATAYEYMSTATKHITEDNPVGAYSVENITYEIGTSRGLPMIAFNISYRHDRTEILRIKSAETMEEASERIYEALNNCDDSVVIKIKEYEARDYSQLVVDYADRNPDLVVEIPGVKFAEYPQFGKERILELNFTYQSSHEQLKTMQERVQTVFTSAELYVKETTDVLSIYNRLFVFLMERDEYTLETSITPAYSLLHYGVGDSRAFANVYAAMCRRARLDCRVVKGTRDGNPWYWNMIRYRGKYHHVDLLASNVAGALQMFPDDAMVGYVWDYSMYPVAE